MKYKLELIEWYDAQADCTWCEEKDIDKWMNEDFLAIEVGWIIRETKDMLVITNCIANDGSIGNRTKVPKPWLKSRTTLQPKKANNGKKTRD